MTQLYRRMVWIVILLAAAVFLAPPRPAHAATFTVNSTADAVDANPGNGVCATAGGVCTLRAAIQEANALAGADTIVFAVDGTFTLTLTGSGEDAAATGDLDITDDLTITGNGQALTIIDGNLTDRVFETRPAAATTLTVSMSDLTIQRGNLGTGFTNAGAGIGVDVVSNSGRTNLTLTNVTITNNTTGNSGGGIAVNRQLADTVNPSLTLINSSISNNSANSTTSSGGGIACACTLTMSRSTISGNSAGHTGNTTTAGGGGLFVANDNANLSITNSTISGNSTNSSGGGVLLANNGSIALNHVTVTSNTADADNGVSPGGDGGGLYRNGGTFTIQNSIVQGNTDVSTPGNNDCGGTVTSAGYNVVGSGTGCPSGGTGDSTAAALLGSLADNGGDTLTHLPGGGSAAINRIPNGQSGCNGGASVDQRGAVRADGANRGGAACDSGAVEADSSQTPTAVSLQSFTIHPASPTLLAALLLAAATLLAIFRHRQKTTRNLDMPSSPF